MHLKFYFFLRERDQAAQMLVVGKQFQCRNVFVFSSRRRHTRLQGDWSSDVCSSDLNLEDHLGDIVRKSRSMSGVSLEAAAHAAKLTPEQLEEMEASGRAPKQVDFVQLAGATGLDGRKLEALANGWLPSAKDLGTWRELRCVTTDEGMAVNCYLVWDEVSREAALFDTGWKAEPIQQIISENQLQLRHVFITHTHEDHIAALPA